MSSTLNRGSVIGVSFEYEVSYVKTPERVRRMPQDMSPPPLVRQRGMYMSPPPLVRQRAITVFPVTKLRSGRQYAHSR